MAHLGVVHPAVLLRHVITHLGMVHAFAGNGSQGVVTARAMAAVSAPIRHVHARHIHSGHPHVRHGQQRILAHLRHFCCLALLGGQRSAGIRGAPHRFTEYGVSPVLGRLDNHIVCLSDSDAKFIDNHGLNILTIRLHHRHLQPWNAEIEVGHCRGIDEAKAYTLARLEHTGPILIRSLAVDQWRVAVNILDVSRHHAHLAPVAPIRECLVEALFSGVIEEIEQRALLSIVVVRHHLEVAQDAVARMRMRIRQLDHVLAVIAVGFALLWFDDKSAIGSVRLLKA